MVGMTPAAVVMCQVRRLPCCSTPMRTLALFSCTLVLTLFTVGAEAQSAAVPRGPAWDALRDGNYEAAAQAFESALRTHPSDPLLHLGVGVAYYKLDRADDARASLGRALKLEPRLTAAAALLGTIVYASGDLDGAIAIYERALKAGRDPGEMRQQLERWRAEAQLHAGFQQGGDGRFSLLFEGPEERQLAEHVHRVLEAAYWRIGNRLNAFPGETIPVILYTQEQFRDITRSPSWAAGAYDGRIRIPVGDALRSPAALDRVVVHELAHAMVHYLVPSGVPTWLHEGLAVYFEGSDQRWIDETLAGSPTLVPLAALQGGFTGLNSGAAGVAYAESAAAARVLIDRLGPNLSVFLQSLGSVQSMDAALATFGFTTSDVDAAIRARARQARR
jgi:cytochrome c-type biogenesis protein CcmH/NrfG